MTSEKLQRTSYRDPNTPDNVERTGQTRLKESGEDMERFYRPLERIHNSNLHGWGVVSGLEVTATLNAATLTIQPGVALDARGELISLAVGGNAEVGQNPNILGTTPTLIPVIAATGLVLPTTDCTGDKYLTIQFWESFDRDGFFDPHDPRFRYLHTPRLQLVDVAAFVNDGSRVVLAKVSFGTGPNAGKVSALTEDLRQGTVLPVSSVHVQKQVSSTAAGSANVAMAEAGTLQTRASGGLDLTVPNASDEIHLARSDGGTFAKVALVADHIVARKANGQESVTIDTATGSISAANVQVSAALNVPTIGAGTLNATNVQVSTALKAPTVSAGTLDANDLTVHNGLKAATINATDITLAHNLKAPTISADTLNAANVQVSSALNAPTIGTGALNVATITVGSALNAPAIDVGTVEANSPKAPTILVNDGDNVTEIGPGTINANTVSAMTFFAGTLDANIVNAHNDLNASTIGATTLNATNVQVSTALKAPTINATTLNAANVQVSTALKAPAINAANVQVSNALNATTIGADAISVSNVQVGSSLNVPTIGATKVFVADSVSAKTVLVTDVTASGSIKAQDIGATAINAANVQVSNALNATTIGAATLNATNVIVNGTLNAPTIGAVTLNATNVQVSTVLNAPTISADTIEASDLTVHDAFNARIIDGDLIRTGDLRVSGDPSATFYSVDIGGHVSVGGDLDVNGHIQVGGNLSVRGHISKPGGVFKIDHPLDPANKYLQHSFVESPDRKNVYDGVVALDANGEATVELPDWFSALNSDARYQLTCIGGYAPVYIAREIEDNRFSIAGGKPGMKVSWQVTGIRQDAWARAHPLSPEEEKSAEEKGYYLHPEEHGADPAASIYARSRLQTNK